MGGKTIMLDRTIFYTKKDYDKIPDYVIIWRLDNVDNRKSDLFDRIFLGYIAAIGGSVFQDHIVLTDKVDLLENALDPLEQEAIDLLLENISSLESDLEKVGER